MPAADRMAEPLPPRCKKRLPSIATVVSLVIQICGHFLPPRHNHGQCASQCCHTASHHNHLRDATGCQAQMYREGGGRSQGILGLFGCLSAVLPLWKAV
ncbi:hypothetical protein V5799_025328 [Amblyomma americanum]|uniref:Uncharacterized protein n=1 Tax=Amblyomma americanum TaxID=6943 RepID=A0AAQ4E9K4_AMBAM